MANMNNIGGALAIGVEPSYSRLSFSSLFIEIDSMWGITGWSNGILVPFAYPESRSCERLDASKAHSLQSAVPAGCFRRALPGRWHYICARCMVMLT